MRTSTLIKSAAPATLLVGGPSATYLSWDHIKYYEVERKVINGEASFVVEKKVPDTENKSWVIKVKTGEQGEWKQEGGYYWECTVSGPDSLEINEVDLEANLPSIIPNAYYLRRNLIKACSKNREVSEKQVKAKFDFSEGVTIYNWAEQLFGTKPLNEIEKKVLETASVYFSVKEDKGNGFLRVLLSEKVYMDSKVWACKIFPPLGMVSSVKDELLKRIPTESSDVSDDEKQSNKKRLIYACSENKQFSENLSGAHFTFSEITGENNWSVQLFGSTAVSGQ